MFESRFKSCIVNIKNVELRQLFACDLHHVRYRLNQTFDTCKREHVSCLTACYKPTTPATSRKEFAGTVGQHTASTATSLPALGGYFAVAWLQAYSVQQNCLFQENVYRKKTTIATSLDSWLFIIAFFYLSLIQRNFRAS